MNPCPPRQRLEEFLARGETGPADAALASHIGNCPACQHVLQELIRSLPGLPRGTISDLPDAAGAFLRRLKEEVPLLGPDADAPTETDLGSAPLPPLDQIGPYEVQEVLGSGATGRVFRAYDTDLDRPVAIKILKADLANDPAGRAAFEREARAVAAVRHEHVITIHQVGRVPGPDWPYLVMEYVAGESLRERVRRRGPVPPVDAARLVRQAAAGLEAAHRRGLVHRDVKPANLLVEADSGRVKVTDFGLACAASPNASTGAATGTLLGTPAYMSPEQIRTPGHVDARSDIYGLGAVLYELLLGEPPFRGPTARVLRQALQTAPVPPRLGDPAIPPGLERVVLTCLAKEPGERYPSAAELIADLDRWLAGAEVRGRPAGPIVRLGRWCRRRPGLVAAWGMAGVLAAAVVLLALHSAGEPLRTAERLRPEQERTRAARAEAQRLEARRALERGAALCEAGEVGQGMLWFARALELAPPEADDLIGAARRQLTAWRPQLHVPCAVLPHEGPVYAVDFRPDGRALLTGSAGHTARLWDTATGRLLTTSPPQPNPVTDVHFSPDGGTVLMRRETGAAAVWLTGAKAHRIEFIEPDNGHATAVAFRPDGRAVLTVGRDQAARLWEPTTGELLGSPFRDPAPVAALAFSPDGRTVFTAGGDGRVRRWRMSDGTPAGAPLVHEAAVTDLAVSPDGQALLTGSKDHTARLWELATGRPLAPVFRHKDKVYAVAFAPDGRVVLTGSKDHTARLWDKETARPVGPPLVHAGPVFDVAFAPDGRHVLTGSEDGSARLWEVARPEAAVRDLPGALPITALAFSPDGRTLFTAGGDGAVCRRPAAGGDAALLWRRAAVRALAVSPDGRVLLVGCGDRAARLLDAVTGAVLVPPLMHREQVNAVAFSPDGRTALTGGEDRTARLWDVATGRSRGTLGPHAGAVTAVAIAPDGRTAATGSWDGAVRLWDTATLQPMGDALRHGGAVTAVAFSPEGRLLVTAGRDATARLWDVQTHRAFGPPLSHDQPVRCAVFGPDGRTVLTGGEDQTARRWDVVTGLPIGPPLRHPETVHAVALAPDGEHAVVAGERGPARLWVLPRPVEGSVARVALWVQVHTNLELDADGQVRALDGLAWLERHRRLGDGDRLP